MSDSEYDLTVSKKGLGALYPILKDAHGNREVLPERSKEEDLKKCEGKKDYDLSEFPDQKCVLCDTAKDLVVHHKRYGPHLVKERDFLVVCQSCHRKLHGIHLPRPPAFVSIEMKKTGRVFGYCFPRTDKYLCHLCKNEAKIFDSELDFFMHCVKEHPELQEECE